MKHIGIGILCAFVGYIVVVAVSYFLITRFSSNTHDRSLEAGMSSFFVWGPIGAIMAFVAGFIWSRNSLP